ncbi:hypothetical protein HK098_006632 [Nowakowskiella sp. JEL0407]|nr:hypothetical protein HK098_006632 [Nowakowskiella sp. JEL0407]
MAKVLATLFSRKYCGLCEEAKEALLRVQKRVSQNHSLNLLFRKADSLKVPFEIEEIDIDAPKFRKTWMKYTYDVPVIHLNGKEFMMHGVDEKIMEQAVKVIIMSKKS